MMPNIALMMPVGGARMQAVLPYAALAQSRGGRTLWLGQVLSGDTHHPFIHAAAAGFPVPAGIGVSLMPLRHPYDAAVQAQSVAAATGHPVVAGYGPGSVSFQKRLLGAPYRSQLGAVREYVSILKGLLEGERWPSRASTSPFTADSPRSLVPGSRWAWACSDPGWRGLPERWPMSRSPGWRLPHTSVT